MTLKTIIQRKFRRRWSDLELLVLLEIGEAGSHYAALVEGTGGSTSGVWNVLQNHLLPDGLVLAEKRGGRTFYKLSEEGLASLRSMFK